MDEIVKAAMLKWPKVPHCYGWLGLDARGNWSMRDDAAQARGAFTSGAQGAKGALLRHDKLLAFIERNYTHDERGQWYFQNGPQRVYVELEATPYIWRIQDDLRVAAHTGQAAQVQACLMDEAGRAYLVTDLGFGLVHSLDVPYVAQALDAETWAVQEVTAKDLPERYHFVISPEALHRVTQEPA